MKIIVIGTGYVGLVTGACFSEMGNHVTCVDIDASRVERLREGIIPIYEPGLDVMVLSNVKAGRLQFSTDIAAVMDGAAAVFVAVGTPSRADGSADMSQVYSAAQAIGRHLNGYAVIVDKSTVPVGTADKVREIIGEELQARAVAVEFDVISNPEFLKEGSAITDFMRPDRVIIGADSERARELMRVLYSSFLRNHDRLMFMGVRDAEMTKYVANCMLATRISFMNEVAVLCERLGVDVESVRVGIGSDSRIGYSFIYPGCGYGGSCFPKDVKALISTGLDNGVDMQILRAVEQRNAHQKLLMVEKIIQRFGNNLGGKVFSLWGLAFKPGTDDVREAPSIAIAKALLERGASLRVHDPVAQKTFAAAMGDNWYSQKIRFFDDQYEAVQDADALILVTEWKPYRMPDYDMLAARMRARVIFDGRNVLDIGSTRQAGFDLLGVGRSVTGEMPPDASVSESAEAVQI